MNKHRYILFITIIIFMGWISSVNAQGRMGRVGKIFSKTEANILFGKVLDSFELSKSELRKLLLKTGNYLLVSTKNNKLVLANEKRSIINSINSFELSPREQLSIFSKELVDELLTQSISELVLVESREQVITLTSGAYTLEFSTTCPPICFE
jgi:hypothetical protein